MEEEGQPPIGEDVVKAPPDELIGSAAMRPVFLGNLVPNYSTDQVTNMFERPHQLRGMPRDFKSIPVDRIDVKRGYCFVFLKDAHSQADKEQIEEFVVAINGIEVPNLSKAVRAEFARGDGRVKRKEDDRRKNITPSETLFVVNFHEETTKREDLEMLFEPFGELVRIDMKRNYAFIQFRTVAEATKAKETTNGGKLDQSVLTVEYVARQRENENRSRGDRSRGGDSRSGRDDRFNRNDDDRRRNDDYRRGGDRGGNFRDERDSYRGAGGGYGDRGMGGGGSYEDRGRSDDRYVRRRESPPYRGGGGRMRSRSRSRSPPRRAYDDRDDYRRNGGGDGDAYRSRGASPPGDYARRGVRQDSPAGRGSSPGRYKGVDRDRGYRG